MGLLALGAGASMAATAVVPMSAAASDPGSFTTNPKSMHGALIQPGDPIALGYGLKVDSDKHSTATFYIQDVVASVPVACSKKGDVSTVIQITLANSQVTIPGDDNHIYPSGKNDSADSYQGSTSAPAACGTDNAMYLTDGDTGGVTYTGRILSNDTRDALIVQFHAVDGTSGDKKGDKKGKRGGSGAIDCSSPQQNATGGGTCQGDWTDPVTVTAAQFSTPSPSGGGTGSGGTGSGGTGSGGTGSGGAGTGGTGSGGTGSGGAGSGGTGSGGAGAGGNDLAPGTVHRGTTNTLTVNAVSSSTPAQGVSLPGGSVQALSGDGSVAAGVAPLAVAAQPASPVQSIINAILGPVPVLIPTLGEAISRASTALPWNWFGLLAAVDALLIVAIVIRRRRAATVA